MLTWCILFIWFDLGPLGAPFFKNSEGVPNSPTVGLFGTLWEYKKKGAFKAPTVSKIDQIVCWCHFTSLPKLDKVSYFKNFQVINKKGEKSPFLFRIAPPLLKKFRIMPKWTFHGLHRLLGLIWAWESQIWGQKWCQTTDSLDYRALNRHIIQFSALSPSCTAFHTYYMYYTYQFPNIWCKYLKKAW